jgi:lipooligosaccharide transport system ATP-binding protein
MTAMPPLLEARALVKRLGGRLVVDGVDLTCHSGQVLGLLGPNGAGKTTTLRMLYGFLNADAGTIRFEGVDVTRALDRFKRQLGVCTQEDTFDGDFTVRQNLEIAARYFRPRPPEVRRRVDELLERFALATYADDKPEALSGGFRRRLMIARAVWDLVNGLRAEGLGIVLTTHYMDEAERLSDVLTVLAQGKVVAHGTPKSVLGDMLGEHVVVLEADGTTTAAVAAWLTARGLGEPLTVLGAWHVPLSAEQLADFARAFPALRYEVRPPNLDDLFLKLALPCAG